MFDDGFQMITSIDISGVLIKSMNEKLNDKGPNFKCFKNKKIKYQLNLLRYLNGCKAVGI